MDINALFALVNDGRFSILKVRKPGDLLYSAFKLLLNVTITDVKNVTNVNVI